METSTAAVALKEIAVDLQRLERYDRCGIPPLPCLRGSGQEAAFRSREMMRARLPVKIRHEDDELWHGELWHVCLIGREHNQRTRQRSGGRVVEAMVAVIPVRSGMLRDGQKTTRQNRRERQQERRHGWWRWPRARAAARVRVVAVAEGKSGRERTGGEGGSEGGGEGGGSGGDEGGGGAEANGRLTRCVSRKT